MRIRGYMLWMFCCLGIFPAWAWPADLHIGPYLQMSRPDAITVMWETTTPVIGKVKYGRPGALTREATGDAAVKIHEITLTGLEPDTKYAYAVHWSDSEGGQEKTAGPFEFVSAPPIGTKKFRIAAYGDSRSNNEVHARCVNVMKKYDPRLVINTGDLVQDGRVYAHWKPQFFDPLAPLIRHVPILTVLGNHERNSKHYYNYFSLPGNESWWTYDFGHVRFIGLDSLKPYTEGSPQYTWLENELKKVPADKWIVALFHHPMFSGHPYRAINQNRWAWQPLFQKYGVDLAFVGHDHHFVRCFPIGALADRGKNAVQHITSGGGGAGLYPVKQWSWIEKAVSIHNVTLLDFDGDELRLHVYSENGDKIDEATIVRNAPIKPDRLVAYDAVLWEQGLDKRIGKIEPVTIKGTRINSKVDWVFASPFQEEMKVTARWSHGAQWRVDSERSEFVLEAKGRMHLAATLSAEWPNCYPTPTLTLEVTDPKGRRLFRNNTYTLNPVRVWARRELTAATPPADILIDAEPAEWKGISEAEQFVSADGNRLAEQKTRVRVARDAGNLYVLALLDMADDRVFGQGETRRDDEDIFKEDESFAVHLGNEYRTYTFCVNTRNTQYDAKRTNRKFNATWTSAVSKAAAQWYVEMRIPLKQLDEETLDRINFSHTDGKTETRSEWSATFGRPERAERYGFLKRRN